MTLICISQINACAISSTRVRAAFIRCIYWNEYDISRVMWFPTLWHFDMCRLRRGSAAPFKLRNSKWRSVSSLTIIECSSDLQRLWSVCAYAQADLRLCWSHIPYCWKSHALANILIEKHHNNKCNERRGTGGWGSDPLHHTWKITKLPSQQSVVGHHRPARETPFKWRFAGGSMVARFVREKTQKNMPPLPKFSGYAQLKGQTCIRGSRTANALTSVRICAVWSTFL